MLKLDGIVKSQAQLEAFVIQNNLVYTPCQAIRLQCLKCRNYESRKVDNCSDRTCPLWIFATGSEQRQQLIKAALQNEGKDWSINQIKTR